ncbi:hypothetical protein EOPP23_19565 [Endozoicomonas sp. OPT23]|uniref:protein kinase domain-containing protein n=1 Tax=Endozoicomonas sp. OPT23 TaxID=2072845 RepID=UPI00129AB189|nr:protein kinase [Endozoicomonas sp. OPT23]MRI35169.1 hypothetical protein [Endozoicomonas sp. OPT23]
MATPLPKSKSIDAGLANLSLQKDAEQPKRNAVVFLRGGFRSVSVLKADKGFFVQKAPLSSCHTASPAKLAEKEKQAIIRERHILASLSHPNIIKLLSFDESAELPTLNLEYGGKSLYEIQALYSAKNLKAPFICHQGEMLRIIGEVAKGLKYIHEKQIVHRDIKHQNTLVSEKGQIKIIDFGEACELKSREINQERKGTPQYRDINWLAVPGWKEDWPAGWLADRLRHLVAGLPYVLAINRKRTVS